MLNIPQETEQLARLVAARSGTTPEQVVSEAVAQQARTIGVVSGRQSSPADLPEADFIAWRNPAKPCPDIKTKADLIANMEEIAARSASRPLVDPRSIDEIIGYDDFGLPR